MAPRGQPGHRVAITRERTVSGNNRQWAELRFPMGIGAGRRTAPLFSMKNKGGAVDIVGGRYWLCVFTKGQTYLHKINKDGAHMDGTPNDKTVKMRRVRMSYSANTNAFPPVFMKSSTKHSAGGSFSIYANIKSLKLPVYRDATHGECSDATSCDECTRRGDQGTGLPCDWANGKCMTRRALEDAGVTSANSCSKSNPWASELYMQLGSTWKCKTKKKPRTLSQLLKRWTRKKPAWKPSSTVCAEACYFANMDWAGWTGVYGLGMLPSDKYPASISTGHKYPLEPTPYPLSPAFVAPFFCEGFNYVADTSCTFLSSNTLDSISKTGGSEQCYISKDNPNPCALGASDDRKWVKSGDGKFYFVVDNQGLLEYVEVGPHGPAKCGTSKKMGVFQTPAWIGKSASGVPMPNPAETCSDATCARCLDHMLGRSMARGMLRYDAHSQASGNCKLVTASRVKTTCDGEDMRMTCANGEKIIVEVAKYGRQEDSNRCAFATGPLASKIVPTNANKQLYKQCWEDVTSNVELHCQGKSDCKVRPSKQFASGVCRKLYSYLKVEYSCTTPTGVSI